MKQVDVYFFLLISGGFMLRVNIIKIMCGTNRLFGHFIICRQIVEQFRFLQWFV